MDYRERNKLLLEHVGWIKNFCHKKSQGDRYIYQELYQECCVMALKQIPKFDPTKFSSLKNYLYWRCHHECQSWFGRKYKLITTYSKRAPKVLRFVEFEEWMMNYTLGSTEIDWILIDIELALEKLEPHESNFIIDHYYNKAPIDLLRDLNPKWKNHHVMSLHRHRREMLKKMKKTLAA